MPELSVILVSFNDRVHLEVCLQHLNVIRWYGGMEIFVVDNSSTDGSPELIKGQFPGIKLLENSENLGFGKANNRGIAESSGEFILFLNTDTVVSSRALDILLETIQKNPEIGAVGPALLSGPDTYQVSFGNRVDFFSEILQKGFKNRRYAKKVKSERERRDVGWLSAACLLVRKKALDEAGYFDENFFLYFEDIDLCYRLRSKGWKLTFQPRAHVKHVGGTSTSTAKIFSRYFYRKSQIYFYKKHNSRTSLRLLRVYLWLNFTLSLLFGMEKRGEEGIGAKSFFRLLRE